MKKVSFQYHTIFEQSVFLLYLVIYLKSAIISALPLSNPPYLQIQSKKSEPFISKLPTSNSLFTFKLLNDLKSRIHWAKYKRWELSAFILLNKSYSLQDCPFTFSRDEKSMLYNWEILKSQNYQNKFISNSIMDPSYEFNSINYLHFIFEHYQS